MAPQKEVITKLIEVRVVKHRNSDLLVAISDDLRGLMVPGRNDEEIKRKLPEAVRELLEAEGLKVVSVTADFESDHLPASFMARQFVANAQIEMIH